jgi:hypothetical protein
VYRLQSISQLEATIQIKLPTGYSGSLCNLGSREYVQFYINYSDMPLLLDKNSALRQLSLLSAESFRRKLRPYQGPSIGNQSGETSLINTPK